MCVCVCLSVCACFKFLELDLLVIHRTHERADARRHRTTYTRASSGMYCAERVRFYTGESLPVYQPALAPSSRMGLSVFVCCMDVCLRLRLYLEQTLSGGAVVFFLVWVFAHIRRTDVVWFIHNSSGAHVTKASARIMVLEWTRHWLRWCLQCRFVRKPHGYWISIVWAVVRNFQHDTHQRNKTI